MQQGRRRKWLVLALVLFGVAAVLMFTGQGEELPAPRPEVNFPNKMRRDDWKRAEKRRTYLSPLDAGTAVAQPLKPRDPVLDALPRGEGKTAVVIEANAIRHSPLGQLLLECMMRRGGKDLERFKKETGVDPLEDVDRLVVTDDGFMVSGHFGDSRVKDLLSERGATSYDYGDGSRIFEPPTTYTLPDGGTGTRQRAPMAMGVWNDQMIVFGRSPDGVKEAIDRIEGRGPDVHRPPVISEGSTYGEMYGVVSVEQFTKMLPPEQRELAERLKEAAENVELHMDVRQDFAMVAEVSGADEDKVTDLSKSLGGALSMARMQAQAEGEKELAELLDFAKVRPGGTGFKLELAVPLEVIQKQLAWCKEEPTAEESPSQEARPTP
jgi:hypothetical protein